ncbi:MAG TPA: hypothetical protein VEI01_02255 [Terriglobales bacterium]|nr:hypothetical protein [Terriglobales bacterium]
MKRGNVIQALNAIRENEEEFFYDPNQSVRGSSAIPLLYTVTRVGDSHHGKDLIDVGQLTSC